jgi:hypothetical protein
MHDAEVHLNGSKEYRAKKALINKYQGFMIKKGNDLLSRVLS